MSISNFRSGSHRSKSKDSSTGNRSGSFGGASSREGRFAQTQPI